MEIFKQVAGDATNTPEVKLQVSKSIGSIIFTTSKNYNELLKETIQIEIERPNASNFEITKGAISLKKFLLATTYGSDSLISYAPYELIAISEISQNGSIHLFEKDILKITLRNLDDNHSYKLNGLEEPTSSLSVYQYESKSMASDDTNKDFNVEGYDIAILDITPDITEISYTVNLSDGSSKVIKYDEFELIVMSRSIDPVAYVRSNGTVYSGFNDYLQLPLMAVSNLNIRKIQGSVVNLLLRTQI